MHEYGNRSGDGDGDGDTRETFKRWPIPLFLSN